jgi:hypothetical protein
VAVLDALGNLVPVPTDVTLALGEGAELHGAVSAVAIGGHAVFGDLSVRRAGTHVLTASGGGLPPATSESFDVSPAA